MPGQISDALLSAIEEVRDQRDDLYAATVNPRRNATRALAALTAVELDLAAAADYLEDVVRDLEHVAELHRRYTAD